MYRDHEAKIGKITGLKDYFIDRALELEDVTVNSQKGGLSAPQIVSLSFKGVRSEVLLHALEDKEIYVSSGSACSSNHPAISGTLKAVGVKRSFWILPSGSASAFLTQRKRSTIAWMY